MVCWSRGSLRQLEIIMGHLNSHMQTQSTIHLQNRFTHAHRKHGGKLFRECFLGGIQAKAFLILQSSKFSSPDDLFHSTDNLLYRPMEMQTKPSAAVASHITFSFIFELHPLSKHSSLSLPGIWFPLAFGNRSDLYLID